MLSTRIALKENAKKLEVINNFLPAIIYSIDIREIPKFLYINKRGEQLLGYTFTEFLNRKHFLEEITHSEDRDKIVNMINGESSILMRWICKNGKVIWLEHFITCSQELNDGIKTIEGIAIDITRSIETESSLLTERNFNVTIFENTASLIILTDLEGKVLNFNTAAEKLTGYSKADAIGNFFYDLLVLASERNNFKEIISEIDEFKDIADGITLRFQSSNGEMKYLEWRIGTVSDTKSKITNIIWLGIDQTKKRKAEYDLKELNKSLESKVEQRTLEINKSNLELRETLSTLKE
ncbi:MAG: PAS domain-containing protein, partial [Nanoarchaeota archaeon]